MDILIRQQMPVSGAKLKIVIGFFFLVIIVGIVLILDGIKEVKRVIQNNSLNPMALKISNADEFVDVYDFYGKNYTVLLANIKCIRLSYKDKLNHLIYVDDGIEKSICLGFIENNKVREFNKIVNLLNS